MAYAAPEPFDRRFQIGDARNAAEAVEALARKLDRRDGVRSPAPPAVEPNAAEINATAAVEAPKDAASTASVPPAEAESETIATPVAAVEAPTIAAPVSAKPEATAPAAASMPNAATTEPAAEQPSRPEQAKSETEAAPPSVMKSPTEAKKTDAPAVKEPRHAAKTHRRRSVPSALAQSQTFSDPTLQQAQTQARPARVRHAKIAASKPREPGSAIGGPLVNPPASKRAGD